MTLEGTNTWVLRARGETEAVVVDPGPARDEHLQAVAAHGPFAAMLMTHAHPDHVEGLHRFRELTGAPLLAAADVAAAGVTAAGVTAAGLAITAIETPGHTADSVCFLVDADRQRAVLTGDTILGRGTTVVAWPDGNLRDYLVSLERLRALGQIPVLPGHGPALADCAAAAAYYLAHRRARLDQVRAAVAAGATTPAAIVEKVYSEVDRALWPAAEWSVRAQLAYLDGGQRESATGSQPLDDP
jgi:glyoxylase-like metal-dependent hydrolase (beta-lactamase superfamily II)